VFGGQNCEISDLVQSLKLARTLPLTQRRGVDLIQVASTEHRYNRRLEKFARIESPNFEVWHTAVSGLAAAQSSAFGFGVGLKLGRKLRYL
jgi:hypothetical protein